MVQRGFTLIEVLIASVIILLAIGISVSGYQNTNKAIQSSEDIFTMLRPLPIILDNIESRLRDVPHDRYSANGTLLGVSYEWHAEPLKSYAPPARFDPDKGDFVNYPERFAMYQVKVTLRLGLKERIFDYQKLGWTEAPATGFEGRIVE